MILVDTNVLSEAMKSIASPRVIAWLDRNFARCFLPAITVFELQAGVIAMTSGRRRDVLGRTVGQAIAKFGDRIVAFDVRAAQVAAELYGIARGSASALHQPSKFADLQIAAIAKAGGFALSTRNTRDFVGLGLDLVNPWTDEIIAVRPTAP